MDTIYDYIKSYFILSLMLLILSYLTPNESYKRYFQYFIGVWICVLLLQPVLSFYTGGEELMYQSFSELEEELADMEKWQEEGVDIFEFFSMDGESQ